MADISKAAARRFLVRKSGLGVRKPTDGAGTGVLSIAKQVEAVQIDPVMIVDRNHNLVLFNRLEGYRPEQLEAALRGNLVLDYICGNRCFVPMDEYPYFVPAMKTRRKNRAQRMRGVAEAAAAVLSDLERNGPRTSRQIDSDQKVMGYWDQVPKTKATSLALQLMWEGGQVAATTRVGGEITFDLPERSIPPDLLKQGEAISERDSQEFLLSKYYRSFRLFDAAHYLFGWQHFKAADRAAAIKRDQERGILTPVSIHGVRRPYWCLAEDLDELLAAENGGTGEPDGLRMLSPLDNLLWRRERLDDIFDFSYTWEMYVPEAKRKWGPYTMPLLYGDALVGRINLRHERSGSALEVQGVHWEPDWRKKARGRLGKALSGELERLAAYLGAAAITRAGA